VKNVYINKISAYLPNEAVDNNSMESVLGMVDDKPSLARRIVLRSNKIKSRYYAIDPITHKTTHSNTQLVVEAIKKLGDNFNVDDAQLLVCGTTTPDQLMPSHALMVHGESKLKPIEVVSIAGICLSGLTALKYAYTSIKAGEVTSAITTGSENVSASLRGRNFKPEVLEKVNMLEKNKEIAFEKDFLRWMLSDGAGAIGLSDKPNEDGSISLKIEKFFVKSFANVLETCMYAGCEKLEDGSIKGYREYEPKEWLDRSIFSIKQDVKLLNSNILEYTVYKPLEEMLEKKMFEPSKIDWFLPHYSSGYFKDKLYDTMKEVGCDIPQEKWFTNLTTKGNTGSASIYIILEELFNSGKLQKGEKLLCYIPESGRFSSAYMLLEVV